MIAYGYWVDAPATVTGGIALEADRVSITSSTQSGSQCQQYGAGTYLSIATSTVSYRELRGTEGPITVAGMSMAGAPEELVATYRGYVMSYTACSYECTATDNFQYLSTYTRYGHTCNSASYTQFSATSVEVVVGAAGWSSTGTTTLGAVEMYTSTRDSTQTRNDYKFTETYIYTGTRATSFSGSYSGTGTSTVPEGGFHSQSRWQSRLYLW